MQNAIGNLLDFITSVQVTISQKVTAFLIVIAVLIFIDAISGLTYHYQLNNKLEQLKSIQEVKDIYSTDSAKMKKIKDFQ